MLFGLSLGLALPMHAQFGALVSPFTAPQAKTQQELDDYFEIIDASNPAVIVRRVEDFTKTYPQSELLAFAYQYQMAAFLQLSDFDGVLRAGQRALALQPENVNTLLALAAAIPDGVSERNNRLALLRQAEDYADRALQGIATMQIPRQIPLNDWDRMRTDMVAQAHEALGHVAAKRGDLGHAITELELAAYGSSTPNGKYFFRLGAVYGLAGEEESASKALRRAADLGPEAIRQRAMDDLKELTLTGHVAPAKSLDR
jgi:tetratricopeptide (TPR) repeat protein